MIPDEFVTKDLSLRGGYSSTSGKYHFPLQQVCPYTGADDVEAVALSQDATLWAWTAVTAAPPGYEGPVPFGFGVVELVKEKLRIITRLTESDPSLLTFGQPMQLTFEGWADQPVMTWAFEIATGID